MPSNFPAGFDTFNEPSIPEETVLSSAGTGSRNHPEHHRDMGDAIEQIERNVALKDHDHGGGTGDFATPKLVQVNTHEDADTDSGPNAIHHTLGTGDGQAAAGNHDHGFVSNYQICTSTTRPAAPWPGLQIFETDTNRQRIWGTFADNVSFEGLNSTEQFSGSFPNGLDTALWDYSIASGDLTHGKPVTAGGTLSWADGGNAANKMTALRINPADRETQTDDQVITWKTGNQVVEFELPFTEGAVNEVQFRESADKQHYIKLRIGSTTLLGDGYIKVFYTTSGPANEKVLGTIENVFTNIPNCTWRGQLIGRTLALYRNGEYMGAVVDTKSLSSKGPGFRGWGLGMVAGDRGGGQTTPANIDWIRIEDNHYHQSTNRWTLLPVASVPICRLRQTARQQLFSNGTILEWGEEIEDNFGYFTPGNSTTDIVIKEPGLYAIETSLQWDQSIVPDTGAIMLCINGLETTIRNHQYFRGGQQYTPGFSQTAQAMGKLRFAANDVLTVKTRFVVPIPWINEIFSFFDISAKVHSRIDLTYLTV